MNFRSTTQAVVMAAALAAAAPTAMAQSSNSTTFGSRTGETDIQYDVPMPRDAYLDDTRDLRGRGDTMDPDNRGLTPAEISRMTGKVDSTTAGVPRNGSGVQPGNMGPANAKGQ
jgi:hypothetical protein